MIDLWRELRRQLGPRLIMPSIGLLLGLCLLTLAAWRSEQNFVRDNAHHKERLELVTAAAAAEISSALKNIDSMLQDLRNAVIADGKPQDGELSRLLIKRRSTLQALGISGIAVSDRHGNLDFDQGIASDLPPSDTWLPLLRQLEQRGEQHILIGQAVRMTTDKPKILPVLLPLRWTGPSLETALIAFVSLEGLRDVRAIRAAPEIELSLHGSLPGSDITLTAGQFLEHTRLDAQRLTFQLASALSATYEEHSDRGTKVLVSYRNLAAFDLALAARLNLDEALAEQRSADQRFLLFVLGICLFLQFGTVQLLHYVDALHAAHANLRMTEANERRRAHELDATLDAMIQGAMVVDAQRRITVINSVFAELARLPPSLVLESGCYDELLARLLVRGDFGRAQAIEDLPPAITGRDLGCHEQRHELVRMDGVVLDVRTKPLQDGGFIVTLTDITEHRRSLQRIRKLAQEDPLTELANRRQFYDDLRKEASAVRSGSHSAVLLLDLDRFKHVNDTFGHPIGDKLLQLVSDRILKSSRTEDIVARLGGDEFAVLQRGIPNRATAAILADRLVEHVSAPYIIEGHAVEIGTSVGIAIMPVDGIEPEDVMKAADVALYHAKSTGRGSAHFFQPLMRDKIELRRALEQDLKRAVDLRQFEVHYQPIHNIATGSLIGFEALARWRHPERGLVPPSDFIPVAEENGLILQIGRLVIEDAVSAVARWPAHLQVSVNMSPVQLKCAGLLPMILDMLERHGVAGHRVEIEVTEAILLDDDAVIAANLTALDAAGLLLAIDDFGTGYSSLSYLSRFPFRKVKIDRSFVKAINRSSECQAIVEASAMLARRLGIIATAEGIETREELDMIRSLGCDEAQGFLLGHPMEPGAATTLANNPQRLSRVS